MLLDKNSKKVIDLIQKYDNLSDIDKIRLAIYLIENKNKCTQKILTYNAHCDIVVLHKKRKINGGILWIK